MKNFMQRKKTYATNRSIGFFESQIVLQSKFFTVLTIYLKRKLRIEL